MKHSKASFNIYLIQIKEDTKPSIKFQEVHRIQCVQQITA